MKTKERTTLLVCGFLLTAAGQVTKRDTPSFKRTEKNEHDRNRKLQEPALNPFDCSYGFYGLSVPPLPGKKGIGQEATWELHMERVKKLNVSWNFSWNSKRVVTQPDDIEFIPMVWGRWNVQTKIEEDIIPEFKANLVHRILAFNEPDHKAQANMPVEQVVDFWPLFEMANIPLASPSVAHPLGNWTRTFFQTAAEKCLRMEYTALHWYGDNSVQNFKKTMIEAYNLYGKRPLLITEFGVTDWSAQTPEQNKFSASQVLAFMKEVLPWLEQSDFVAGYSWFNFWPTFAAGSTSSLYDGRTSMELTALGRFYASVTPKSPMGDQSIVIS